MEQLSLQQRIAALPAGCRRRECRSCSDRKQHIANALEAAHWDEIDAVERELAAAATIPDDRRVEDAAVTDSAGVVGRVAGFMPTSGVVAATDASWRVRTRFAGLAFVVNDGRWGMKAQHLPHQRREAINDPSGPSRVTVLELRAVYLLLSTRISDATILIDNAHALQLIRQWRRGNVGVMPAGYSLRPRLRHPSGLATLMRLATEVAARSDIKYLKVAGHSGHPLNEAADGLASLIRRRHEGDDVDVANRADGLVRAFLRMPASMATSSASRH